MYSSTMERMGTNGTQAVFTADDYNLHYCVTKHTVLTSQEVAVAF